MTREDRPPILVDIDKERIREIVGEALRMMHEYLQEDFAYTDEQIMKTLEDVIGSNRVASQFFLSIGSNKIPDLVLRVDPVRREVLCKSAFRKKVARLNNFIKVL